MKRMLISGIAALAVALFATRQVVDTYYDDAHYSYTYYMARVCGYTPLQAYRIASADVSIDYSALTEPVQFKRLTKQESIERGLDRLPTGKVFVDPEEPRVRFHAFRDHRLGSDLTRANAEIVAQAEHLFRLGVTQQNFGVYLHFLQDEYSHAGYTSRGGHWYPESGPLVAKEITSDLWGSRTDYLSNNARQTAEMTRITLAKLSDFMPRMSPSQRPLPCSPSNVDAVLRGLVSTNLVPSKARQYGSQVTEWVEDGTPSKPRADEIVGANLGRDLPPYYPTPMMYEYTASGELAGASLDTFTVVGDLDVRLQGDGAAQGPVAVSVWAAPTREGELPYLLACEEKAQRTARFTRLPVGNLVIQGISKNGTATRDAVSLSNATQSANLLVPFSTSEDAQCDQKLVDTTRQLCQKVRQPGGAIANDASVSNLERQMDAQLKEASTCRAEQQSTRNVVPPSTAAPADNAEAPKKGMSSAAKAGIILGAAAGGGVALAAVTKMNQSTEESGGTSGGSSSNTVCLSTRNCIYSGLSCSCSGSTSGSCGYPPPAGSTSGGRCPCAPGYSCTNNVCTNSGSCR